jgi:hypothetical protein
MLKKLLVIVLGGISLLSCQTNPAIEKADNALDGGRYFIENYMKGDFKTAHFYIVNNPPNQAIFDSIASQYFGLDKEGRMQLRQASIQINNVEAPDTATGLIHYQNSFDKTPHTLKVVHTADGWKVDLKNSSISNL